jgi:uncharacterized protein YeaO (DUF488 family)
VKTDVRLKRAYEPAEPDDGFRILIDRLWPRGVSRRSAALDGWNRELAPSGELRRWFGHDPDCFAEFRRRYLEELRDQRPALTELRRRARRGRLTLVYGAKDRRHTMRSSLPRSCGAGCRDGQMAEARRLRARA